MKGTVFLRGYKARAPIGCSEEERAEAQPLLISVSCATDMTKAVRSDTRVDCVDYCALHSIIGELLTYPAYHLLESLANQIAQAVMRLQHVIEVTVTIEKPNKLPECEAVG